MSRREADHRGDAPRARLFDAPDEAATRRAAREIAQDATSPNTERSENSALRYWSAWYRLRYRRATLPLPVPAKVIMQFIVDHGRRKSRDTPGLLKTELPAALERALVKQGIKKPGDFSLATILHRVSMIGRLNRAYLNGHPNPVADPDVRSLLSALRLAYVKRQDDGQRQMPALTVGPLQQLLGELEADLEDPTKLWKYRRALRDRALILFGFATGGRRRSEIVGADVARLKEKRNGAYRYTLGPTKSTTGKRDTENRERPVEGAAAAALTAWLKEAGLRSGPIFRHIARDGRITADALSPESVRNLLRRLSKQLQSQDALDETFSAHSLRSGFMTEAANQGISLPEAMAFSGHRSVQSAVRYYRAQDKSDSPAAHLFDGMPRAKKRRPK